ncbi:MAG: NAD-dependent epimerase/dehydratase family protein [Chitinispirillaceae bacterium]|nr:NAD-dependent epimerase/dehydratase family protein [Chitinispirillaceae bacterium]
MKIFITGSTGFIGSHFIKQIAGKGHKLVCLVRETSNLETLNKYKCTLVYGDVTDKDSVNRGMKGCDCAVNLAGIYSLWERDSSIYYKVNVLGTRYVMEASLENNLEKVVHVSTVAIYGKPEEIPFVESSTPGPVRFSEYARTKYAGEIIAWDLFKKNKLPLVVIYPAVVIGPGDTKVAEQYARLIRDSKLPALACVNSKITWVHVDDVASAIEKALVKDNNIGMKYIIGKEQITIGDYFKNLFTNTSVKLPHIILPDWLAVALSTILTIIADITGRPPLWGMSKDQISTMKTGISADGSLVERELNLHYSSVLK